ncbi:Aste57867_14750 [Aphanomyces stellatus]|uniref:Aste57867_14750 protein n=1 Tax=Aphanomyces stellatus TaxID=120398 RepID=A0A485L220_9STRA|nr:hypothetical protein As57867_014695 [Aphanomyces stellatus]VFT91568.1 Aste57867_14750 [Aphanomyces stellatus]
MQPFVAFCPHPDPPLVPGTLNFGNSFCLDWDHLTLEPLAHLMAQSSCDYPSIAQASELLTRWVSQHGPSRLRLLFALLPRVRSIIALAAVCANNVSLVHHLDIEFDVGTLCEAHNLVETAARFGHVDVLRLITRLPRFNFVVTTQAIVDASKHGQVAALQFLHDWDGRTGGAWTTRAMDFAAANGHIVVVEWLHMHRTEGCSHWALDGAARNGHLKVVHFLVNHRTEGRVGDALVHAAREGHLKVVQYLLTKSSARQPVQAICAAVEQQRYDVVDTLYQHGGPTYVDDAVAHSKSQGNARVVELLQKVPLTIE